MGEVPSRQTYRSSRRAVLAGAAATIVSACSPRPAAKTLRFWATSYEGDYAPHLMTAFTAATGIEVDVQSLPSTAAHEKMLTAFAGGAMPDVFVLPSGWIGEFALIGAVTPLPSPDLVEDVVPAALAMARLRGRDSLTVL